MTSTAVHDDPFLKRICDELASVHRAHTILLYGSRAHGTAGPASDYDLAAFGPVERKIRDARVVEGAFLDAFVYPESVLFAPEEAHLGMRGGKILAQRGTDGDGFLAGLEALFERGPRPLPADEIEALRVWAVKMVGRIKRGDIEGDFRRVWLLTALLEDYFLVRGAWFEGPKRALQWLKRFDPETHAAFSAALKPGASDEAIVSLVQLVTGRDAP